MQTIIMEALLYLWAMEITINEALLQLWAKDITIMEALLYLWAAETTIMETLLLPWEMETTIMEALLHLWAMETAIMENAQKKVFDHQNWSPPPFFTNIICKLKQLKNKVFYSMTADSETMPQHHFSNA